MGTKTDICNLALQLMGARSRLVDVDTDNTEHAGELKTAYPNARDLILRAHNWNFAMTQGVWPALATAPAFGFAKRYQLAAAPFCLRFVRFDVDRHGRRVPKRIVGRELHTDEGAPVYVWYVARIEDEALFDPMFVEALAAKLAERLGYRITQRVTIAREMRDFARELARDARWADAIETDDESAADQGEFLDSRGGF